MQSVEDFPNNVGLSQDKRLLHMLDEWRPDFLNWWREMGPDGFKEHEVFLRTAISVEASGWAHYDYVRMPEYRWGIFLTPPKPGRTIGFGDHQGKPTWSTVPDEYRDMLRRLLVVQADTETASVEQQRLLCHTAPSLYDLRNLFQVSVEEGRHVWAIVYLLHSYFGGRGREEAASLLSRRSGGSESPRILGAFNEPVRNWLDFFMFTMFTDRVGKFQLHALAESGFDPLSRTCEFMLTEEAHHMFVGDTGIGRIVKRSCALMQAARSLDPECVATRGGIPLTLLQRYINRWFSLSEDLFGGEISANAADYFAAGLKGRYREADYAEHSAQPEGYEMEVLKSGRLAKQTIPLRAALNEVQRNRFTEDCQRAVDKWNRIIDRILGPDATHLHLRLPHRRFHRQIGIYSMSSGCYATPDGEPIDAAAFLVGRDHWLPSARDEAYVERLMQRVCERGKIAGWLAPPLRGINGKPFDFEYVREPA